MIKDRLAGAGVLLAVVVFCSSFQTYIFGQSNSPELLPIQKLSPELQLLVRDFSTNTRSLQKFALPRSFTDSQLRSVFGLDYRESVPQIFVAITLSASQPSNLLEKFGASVITSFQDRVIVSLPVYALDPLTKLKAVKKVEALSTGAIPRPTSNPSSAIRPRTRGASASSGPLVFDASGLTGKGVIVGIVDTGIDWRNPAFVRADGTSRVIALWDITDDSFERSGGKVGTKPPVSVRGVPLGTLYTNDQLNRALSYEETVNSRDENGHGTAVAGVAASNGRGSPKGFDFKGVASESDLLIVRASACGGFHELAEFSAEWLFGEAERLNRPIVVNMSFGTALSDRDGSSTEELFLNSLVGVGKKGRAITVAAGNDGRENLHAVSIFGKKGQPDEAGSAVSVAIVEKGQIVALFDSRDSWRLSVIDPSGKRFGREAGKPAEFSIVPSDGRDGRQFRIEGAHLDEEVKRQIEGRIAVGLDGFTSKVVISLPEGSYYLEPQGGATVVSGRADFYAVTNDGSTIFGTGVSTSELVSSPGNAVGVITVGSYVGRNSWVNQDGDETIVNLKIGSISAFSSRGFRRDGVVKPDLVAPGEWVISPLSGDAGFVDTCRDSMAVGDRRYVVFGGNYIVWNGTSAATPYLTGLIALMLEKNPHLDSEQILKILKETASAGLDSGALPNPTWGWGAVNPEKALLATPALR